MKNPHIIGDEMALNAASEAQKQHDDRTAIELLIGVLKTPNSLIWNQAFIRIKILLLRLRGPGGFREFLKRIREEGLLPESVATQLEAVAESNALILDYMRGYDLGDRALRSLEKLQKLLLVGIQRSVPPTYTLQVLFAYLQILVFSVCTHQKDSLHQFCEKHSLQMWPDNQGRRCLVPVSYVQEILDGGDCNEILPEFVIAAAHGVWASLLLYPGDGDAATFVRYFLAQIEKAWAERLRDSVQFFGAVYQALELFAHLNIMDDSKIRSSIDLMATTLAQHETLSTSDLREVRNYSGTSGSTAFLQTYVRGRQFFEQGDFSESGRVFDDLLQRRNISLSARKKILQSRISSDIGRIRVCTSIGLSAKTLLKEAEYWLTKLRELEGHRWSMASAKLYLDYFVLSDKSSHPPPDDVVEARRFLLNTTHAIADQVALVDSDYLPTLVDSGLRLGTSVDQVVKELAAAPALEALADLPKIIRGEPVPEPIAESADNEEVKDHDAMRKDTHDDFKWLKEVIKGPSLDTLRDLIKTEVCWIIGESASPIVATQTRVRLCVNRIIFQLVRKLVSNGELEIASRLMGYVSERIPDECLPEETETLIHMEAAILFGKQDERDSLESYEGLLSRIIDFAGDRSAGELSMGTRKLLGDVNRRLGVLRTALAELRGKDYGK